MKKIITLLAALFFIPASSNDLYVYNNTSYTLYYKIGARPSDGSFYPFLYSLGPVDGHFVFLGPASSTAYTNAGGFPFYSPSSSPAITTWERRLTSASPWVNTASSLAQSMFGSTHRYSDFKFYVEDSNANVIGSGNIDPIDLDVPLETPLGEDMWTTYLPLGDDVFILFDQL
jgi:hypothetical protein